MYDDTYILSSRHKICSKHGRGIYQFLYAAQSVCSLSAIADDKWSRNTDTTFQFSDQIIILSIAKCEKHCWFKWGLPFLNDKRVNNEHISVVEMGDPGILISDRAQNDF